MSLYNLTFWDRLGIRILQSYILGQVRSTHSAILHFGTGAYVTEFNSEFVLGSAGTLLWRVRALPPMPWPDWGPGSLRSPSCGQATNTTKNQSNLSPYCSSLLTAQDKNAQIFCSVEKIQNQLMITSDGKPMKTKVVWTASTGQEKYEGNIMACKEKKEKCVECTF
ncbi:hypothetical protein PoB_000346000 [Plakobranchus ocellatus]|uniref:Ig-like domain-containing protein n=1 Tax=Plakobranchus ocellatus TaxID=259542 RepID=A0AAV3Y1K2_9GAST|nr:hypothetical protein PoB_000346000 [Plakobranchus ocellatus]